MKTLIPFDDRIEAGIRLGEKLKSEDSPAPGTLVLGLVRGGAVIAKHLAETAGLEWDILLVRKIGAPRHSEYAVGAYAEFGELISNKYVLDELGLDQDWLELQQLKAAGECERLHRELRGSQPAPKLAGREIIICDDGMATGLTMFAAVEAVKRAGALSVTVAVPVLPPDALGNLKRRGIVHTYLACPAGFQAVGQFYRDFTPVTSRQVSELLTER